MIHIDHASDEGDRSAHYWHGPGIFRFQFEAPRETLNTRPHSVPAWGSEVYPLYCWHNRIVDEGVLDPIEFSLSHVPTGAKLIDGLLADEVYPALMDVCMAISDEESLKIDPRMGRSELERRWPELTAAVRKWRNETGRR